MNLRDAKEITIGGKSVKKIEIGGKTAWGSGGQTPNNCLRFSSSGPFTLAMHGGAALWDGTIESSTDGATWAVWDGTTTLSAGVGATGYALFLRGTGNTVVTGITDATATAIDLTGTDVRCDGNITTLLDYQTVASGGDPDFAANCFAALFRGCAALISAPDLPSLTLKSGCYRAMFHSCTSLTSAPDLPATLLPANCYQTMFFGCTSISGRVVIPAESIGEAACQQMFHGAALTELDLSSVITIATSSAAGGPLGEVTTGHIIFSKNLASVGGNTFGVLTRTSQDYYITIPFDDSDTIPFKDPCTPAVLIFTGDGKGQYNYNIYTDNTAIHDGVLSKVDQYTIVNVYHLDGSAWA